MAHVGLRHESAINAGGGRVHLGAPSIVEGYACDIKGGGQTIVSTKEKLVFAQTQLAIANKAKCANEIIKWQREVMKLTTALEKRQKHDA